MEDFGTIHRLPIISSEPDNDTEDSSVNKCSTEPTTTLTDQEQASDTLFTHKHSVTYFPSDTPTQHLENILCIPFAFLLKQIDQSQFVPCQIVLVNIRNIQQH